MNNYRKYTTKPRDRKVFTICMAALLALIVALGVLEACGVFRAPVWEPDVEIPMTNANVGWKQTWRKGTWNE